MGDAGDITVKVNRAPVLTLWAAVVARRLGYDWEEALTLGRAVAGLNAYSKAVAIGLYPPRSEAAPGKKGPPSAAGEVFHVDLLRRAVPAERTAEGIRALSKEKPIDPASVERYLESKFGEDLAEVRKAMETAAQALAPEELAERAYEMYETFRPRIPSGTKGWGAAGDLSLRRIRDAARS
jgi:hypothetical protein